MPTAVSINAVVTATFSEVIQARNRRDDAHGAWWCRGRFV